MAITRSMARAARMEMRRYRLMQVHEILEHLHNLTPLNFWMTFVCEHCRSLIMVFVDLEDDRIEMLMQCHTCNRVLAIDETYDDPGSIAVIQVTGGFQLQSWRICDDDVEWEAELLVGGDRISFYTEDDGFWSLVSDELVEEEAESEEMEDEGEEGMYDDNIHNYNEDEENDDEVDRYFDDELDFVPDEEHFHGENHEDDGDGGGANIPLCVGLCIVVEEL
ncbi:hypothetical protein LXL04_029102 [Taraxacum kok-saghyz]